MSVLLGFAPWILYWVLVSNNTFEEAAVAGLVASVALVGFGIMHGEQPKLLNVASGVWFLILTIVAFTAEEEFFADWSYVLSNFALAAIVLFSILIGQPFTRQYARDEVQPQFWNSPVFLQSTLMIAWAWFAAMVVMGFSSLLAREWPEDELWWNWIVPIGAFVAVIKFTAWYPDRLRQEAGLGSRSA